MGKTVRYKLNKCSSSSRKKKGKRGSKGKKLPRLFCFKHLKTVLLLLLILALGYWIYIAYTTVRDIKIVDVIGESEVVEFSQEEVVRKSLVVYEDPNATEQKNLFILAVIYNPDISESLTYYFPKNLYVKDYLSNREIPVCTLTYAGDSYMYDEKYAYVVRQIEEQMGIKFDSYVWLGSKIGENFVGDISNDPLSVFSSLSLVNLMPRYYKVHLFEEYFHSNMSFLEMYSFFQNMNALVSSGNNEFVDLGTKEMTFETSLSTGEKVRVLSTSSIDDSLRGNIDVLRTRDLSREHAKIEVYNASDIQGYAQVMGRKIYNAGCRVIRYETASEQYDETKIYVTDKERFANALSVVSSVVSEAEVIEGRPSFLTTGDIIVVLGQDQ